MMSEDIISGNTGEGDNARGRDDREKDDAGSALQGCLILFCKLSLKRLECP